MEFELNICVCVIGSCERKEKLCHVSYISDNALCVFLFVLASNTMKQNNTKQHKTAAK